MSATNKVKILRFIKKHWKLILALAYLISPIDLIPDVLMPIGYTEDILVVVAAVLEYLVKRKKDKRTTSSRGKIYEGEIVD